MNFPIFDSRECHSGLDPLPIVISCSGDGQLQSSAQIYINGAVTPVGPRLRLTEYDLGIVQIWPIYRSLDINNLSAEYLFATSEVLDRQIAKAGSHAGILIDLVESQDPEFRGISIRSSVSTEGSAQVAKLRLSAAGFTSEILGELPSINEAGVSLSTGRSQHRMLQLEFGKPILDDQLVINAIHQTKLQVCLREMIFILSGTLRAEAVGVEER